MVVILSISVLLIPFISASFIAVKSMNDGSFFFPRLGTGARKGLSVSTKILSKGINLNVSCKSNEFLKVIIPLAEIKGVKKSEIDKITTTNFNNLFFN